MEYALDDIVRVHSQVPPGNFVVEMKCLSLKGLLAAHYKHPHSGGFAKGEV